MALCEKWQRQAAQLNQGTKLENKEAVMETFITATKKAEKGEFTESTARQVLNQLLEAMGQAPMQLVTIEEYLKDWVTSKSVVKAKGTALRYQNTIDTFLKHLGTKSKSNLASLAPKDIEKFRDLQIKEGKSPATANMVVKTLRIPLNLARRQGIILTNPAEAVELLPVESGSRDVFTPEQIQALYEAADIEWKGLILIGATAGLRIGDAATLTWENIDLNRKVIRYFPQKTARATKRKPLEVIILPDLEKYLLSLPLPNNKPSAPLFPTLSKKSVSGDHGLSLTFRRLMDKAGIEAESVTGKVKGKGRQFFNLGFHSLRKTFVSMMANVGVSKELRMKLVGHASEAVHDVYTKVDLQTLQNALKSFPTLLKD